MSRFDATKFFAIQARFNWKKHRHQNKVGGRTRLPLVPIHFIEDGLHILTNTQWKELAKLAGFSPKMLEARQQLETIICHYVEMENREREKEQAQLEVDQIRELQKRVLACADALEMWNFTGSLGMDSFLQEFPDEAREIDDWWRIKSIVDMTDWLRMIEAALSRSVFQRRPQKRGPKSMTMYWLVRQLVGLRQQITKLKTTRSYKDKLAQCYVLKACKIANPKVGTGTISNALRIYGRITGVQNKKLRHR